MKTSTGYLSTSKAVKRQQQCRRYKMIAAAIGLILVSLTNLCLLIMCLACYSNYFNVYLWVHV